MLTEGFKKCCKYRTYSIFGVFRFLLSRGIYIHLPSQENEIQNLSQQSVTVCGIKQNSRFFEKGSLTVVILFVMS